MSKIIDVQAREILDSRGNPTVEVDIRLDDYSFGRGMVPSGASTGSKEALELRDKDINRFSGKGVLSVVNNIHSIIAPKILNQNAYQQQEIDQLMIDLDGSDNKRNLGANAILGVSLAIANAAANSKKIPLYRYLQQQFMPTEQLTLPMPMFNIINGGVHADNLVDIQEFLIMPLAANNFTQALELGHLVINKLKALLKKHKLNTNVGDEGGFAPNILSNESALDLILEAVVNAGLRPHTDIALCLDFASNEFYRENKYCLSANNQELSSSEFVDYIVKMVKDYQLFSIEDPLQEDDWESWQKLTKLLAPMKTQIVGDDLFVTNQLLLQKGFANNVANAILIKINQIGTVTETFKTIALAKANNYNTVISHRSGETEDNFIADLAVAANAGQIKTGSLCRSERIAKYNQLLRIQQQLTNPILVKPYV
jgi:enolase